MLKVGLTGGIGCGKSTVCTLFNEFGTTIIDTDEIAREVVEPNTPGIAALINHFSQAILQQDGQLDRKALRQIVFSDPDKLQLLESILHPLIRTRLREILDTLHTPYVIIAIPLLVEKGWQTEVDRVLVIDCTEEKQLERVQKRDGSDRQLTSNIIQSQVSRQRRLAAADDIIHNDKDIADLREQVERMHLYYSQLAANL
jgi:dephospho-CoA kinase